MRIFRFAMGVNLALVALTPFKAKSSSAESSLEELCGAMSRGEVAKWIEDEVLGDPVRIGSYAEWVAKHNQVTSCHLGAEDLLTAKRKEGLLLQSGALILGLLGNIRGAVGMMAEETQKPGGEKWFFILKEFSESVYLESLEQWFEHKALMLRKEFKLALRTPERYGLSSGGMTQMRSPVDFNPVLISSYLNETRIAGRPMNRKTLNHLNVLYAISSREFRAALKAPYAKSLREQVRPWILTLRQEPDWVLFRMLPVLVEVAGSEVVRELMWLSEHHQNEMIKNAADSSLERAISKTR